MMLKPAGRRRRNSSMSSLPKTANRRVSNASSTPEIFGMKTLKGQYKGLVQMRPLQYSWNCNDTFSDIQSKGENILIEP